MVTLKQLITHQYLLLDVTGAKNVPNILSLFDIFDCPHSIVVHAPHLPILYFPLMCTVIHHFLSIWSSHQAALCMLTSPCVSPAHCSSVHAGCAWYSMHTAPAHSRPGLLDIHSCKKKLGSFVCLVTTKIRLALQRSDAAQCTEMDLPVFCLIRDPN